MTQALALRQIRHGEPIDLYGVKSYALLAQVADYGLYLVVGDTVDLDRLLLVSRVWSNLDSALDDGMLAKLNTILKRHKLPTLLFGITYLAMLRTFNPDFVRENYTVL